LKPTNAKSIVFSAGNLSQNSETKSKGKKQFQSYNSEAGKITIKIQQTIIHNKLSFDVFEMYWQLKTQLKRME